MTDYTYFVDLSSWFIILFLIGTAASSIFSNLMDWLNTRTGKLSENIKKLHSLHPLMKKFFTRNKIQKAEEYNREHNYFNDLSTSAASCVTTIVLLLGLTPFVLHSVITAFPSLSLGVDFAITSILMSFLTKLCDIPFSYYRTFNIENRYGFNRSTKMMFIFDEIKEFIVSSVFMSAFILIGNYFLTAFGRYSYPQILCFILGITLFSFICEFLYLNVVMRLFNKFEPLKDKKLLGRVKKLFSAYGYNADRVFVMDESKRSNHSNAFISGFGKNKKIVLFDTLLNNYTHDELIAILGHELAHGKLGHLIKGRIYGFIDNLIFISLTFMFIYNVDMYHAFGYTWVTEDNVLQYSIVGLTLATMMIGAFKWMLEPIDAYISRKQEYEADRYSVLFTKKKDAMISSLIKLASENLSDLFPNKYYEAAYYGHPSLMNRISAVNSIHTKGETKTSVKKQKKSVKKTTKKVSK